MKLTYKIILGIIFVAIFCLTFVSFLFISYATNIIEVRIANQLESIGIIKENQLQNYLLTSSMDLERIASNELLDDYFFEFGNVSELGNSGNLNEMLENKIYELLNSEIEYSAFEELSVLSIQGKVYLSTKDNEKGKIKSGENYFIYGLNETFIQSFYVSISTFEPALTIATPIKNKEGKVVGLLTGNVKLGEISKIMSERSGLGETGETILINNNHLLVTESRFDKDAKFKKTVHTIGIKECLANNGGFKKYSDYRNVDIMGFFIWIPEREVCLVTKIDSEEAYASLKKVYFALILMGLAIAIGAIIMAYILSGVITRPVNKLISDIENISGGNYEIKLLKSNDEFEQISEAYVDMTSKIKKSKTEIEKINQDLENQVEKKTLELSNKVKDLEKFNKFAIDRELRMIELKKEIEELKNKSIKEIK